MLTSCITKKALALWTREALISNRDKKGDCTRSKFELESVKVICRVSDFRCKHDTVIAAVNVKTLSLKSPEICPNFECGIKLSIYNLL